MGVLRFMRPVVARLLFPSSHGPFRMIVAAVVVAAAVLAYASRRRR